MSSAATGEGVVGSPYGPLPTAFAQGVFPREYVARGEGLIYETRPTGFVLVGPIVRFVFLLLVFFVIPVATVPSIPGALVAFLFIVFVLPPLLGLVIAILRWTKTAYALTDRRVLDSTGVVSRNLIECSFEKFQTVSMHQGIFGRLFGYGNLVFTTAGLSGRMTRRRVLRAGGVFWHGVRDPVNTRRFVEEVREITSRQKKIVEFQDMARVLQQSGGAPSLGPTMGPGPGPMPSGVSTASPPSGMGIAERTQTQIAQLEQSIQQQKDLLFKLDQGLAEGRIENATYSDIQKKRTQEIGDLERQLAEQKARLSRQSSGETGGSGQR